MQLQRDWPKDKKNYSSFNFLAENLEKFPSTEHYGAPLEGSLGKKAIMQRGSIEHEQIMYISSKRCIKRVAGAGCHSVGVAAEEE